MLNPRAFLNPDLFEEEVEQISPREGFGQGIVKMAEEDERIVVLCADLTQSLNLTIFKEKFPERFIEVGVAEQNLVAIASGVAAEGKIPFACSFAVFSPGRNWEQIRTTICLNDRPVKIIGSHAGLATGPDGATHQALEDLALMRVLPNMVVVSPADTNEAYKATIACAKVNRPCYLRLPRNEVPIVTEDKTPFKIGKGEIFWDSSNGKIEAVIMATGQLVYQALLAAKKLELDNISVRVINIHTIKPLDENIILQAAKEAKAVVTVEDHEVIGGLGSAVAEVLSQSCPTPLKIMGIQDKFGESGEPKELLEKYGLSSRGIYKEVSSILQKGKDRV